MTLTPINPQAGSGVSGGGMFFGSLPDHVTGPVFMERPAIRPPRSSARIYSDSELATAASMLNKLRCRDDQKILANAPEIDDAEYALDVAVDRLLRVLR
jgi:hypothetical protein